jgi:hypothetical protein
MLTYSLGHIAPFINRFPILLPAMFDLGSALSFQNYAICGKKSGATDLACWRVRPLGTRPPALCQDRK